VTRRTFLGTVAASAAAAGERPAPGAMGLSPDCFRNRPKAALDYVEFAHSMGAGGVQTMLDSFEPEYLKKLRGRVEEYGMYLEISTMLPKQDAAEFERVVKGAKQAGARAIRSVCLVGRRYETFSTLEEWKEFAASSRARLALAAPIVARERIPMGIENHKDWTIEEMVPLMKQFGGEYLGVCLDWGNNISLLDDPMELARALGPYTVNSHIKDVAVEEYPEGFLLAEVPLGEGCLDLKGMLAAITGARPGTRFSLDMLTRNPLKVPCVTERYWATMPTRGGEHLAGTLRMVRAHKPAKPLVYANELAPEARTALEAENVRRSLDYSRDELGLRRA
jgi:sugar phosphate isomerase/epimerase